MKKATTCILMFLFVFLFSGCSARAPEKINMHIDSSFKATMGDLELEGLLIYTEEGEMYLDISTPDELYGLSFSFKDNFTLGYRGLNAVTQSDYLPPSSFAQSIKNSLDNIALEKPLPEPCENTLFVYRGKSDSGSYKVYTDIMGVIKEIEIVGCDIKIKLSH